VVTHHTGHGRMAGVAPAMPANVRTYPLYGVKVIHSVVKGGGAQ